MNKFIKWWVGEKLPEVHLETSMSFVKKWVLHPVKRRLAKYYLLFLQKTTDIKVIGITGSAGKTTTKEMLASILKNNGKTIYSVANIDPIYNIPNTILKTPIGTKYLVLEMGIEYPGEMDFYLWLATPDIGIITNIFPTHLEFMKDIQGVFDEKSKLAKNLSKSGNAILNADDPYLRSLSKRLKAETFWFNNSIDPITTNFEAAKLAAKCLQISENDIEIGLKNFAPAPHRMSVFNLSSGAVIFDDSYNSNPQAFLSSLGVFVNKFKNYKMVAVVGDMLELGELKNEHHKAIGDKLSHYNFEAVIGVGKLSKFVIDEIKSKNNDTKTVLLQSSDMVLVNLQPYLKKGYAIFVKGSRSIGLDKVVDKLV